MARWYRNLSIKYKILLLFYAILAIYSAVYYGYSTRSAMRSTLSKVGETNLILLRQMDANLSFMRRELEDMTTQLVLQPQVQAYLRPRSQEDGFEEKLYVDANIRDAVNLIVSKDYFASLAIVGFENRTVPFVRTIDKDFVVPAPETLVATDFYRDIQAQSGRAVWSNKLSDIALFGGSKRHNRILMGRSIKEYSSYHEIGFLLVSISESALRSIVTEGLDTQSSAVVILTEDYELLSEAGMDIGAAVGPALTDYLSQTPQGYTVLKLADQTLLLSHMRSGESGWTYLYGVPMEALTEELDNTRQFIVLFVLTALALAFPLIWFATDLVIRPIRHLLERMRAFQTGDFSATVTLKNRDEIGVLGLGYNEMVHNLQNLVERVYLLQIREREAELTALQAQINPHFLYNMLDSIYWKAQKNRQKDIADMVWHLSALLRMSLNKGKGIVTVGEELRLVEEYLLLQGMRYGGKIRSEVHLEPCARDVPIPKLVIQPFVENAVVHGLEKKEGAGLVRIVCGCEGERLRIVVEDDGVGIDGEVADAIARGDFHNTAPSGGGYAISNIRERLGLLYAGDYTLSIRKREPEGTCVALSLPHQIPEKGEIE